MKIFKTIIIFAIMCACLLSGCRDPFDAANGQYVNDGYGAVTINFDNGDGRTVFPAKVFQNYVYTFTKDEGAPETLTPESGKFILETGSWSVEVKAYAGAAVPANLAAVGTADFTVANKDNKTVDITLEGIAEEGEGNFSYYITYPAGSTVTAFTMQKLPALTESVTLATPGAASASGTASDVPAGFYMLTIRLSKDENTTGLVKVIHIYNGMTSEYGTSAAPIVFTESNFFNEPVVANITITPYKPHLMKTQEFQFTVSAYDDEYQPLPIQPNVTWSLFVFNSNNDQVSYNTTTPSGSTISSSGLLNIHANETLSEFYVKAVLTNNTGVADWVNVKIVDSVELAYLYFKEDTVYPVMGSTHQLNASGYDIEWNDVAVPDDSITWSISYGYLDPVSNEYNEGSGTSTPFGSSISNTGLLTLSDSRPLDSFQVKAELISDPEIYKEVTIKVGGRKDTSVPTWGVNKIWITGAPGSPQFGFYGQSRTIKLVAHIDTWGELPPGYDPYEDIIWLVGNGKTDAYGDGRITIDPADGTVHVNNPVFGVTPLFTPVYFKFKSQGDGTMQVWQPWEGPYDNNSFVVHNYTAYWTGFRIEIRDMGDNRKTTLVDDFDNWDDYGETYGIKVVPYDFPRGQTQYYEVTSTQTYNFTDLCENNVYLIYVNPTEDEVSTTGSVTVNGASASMSSMLSPSLQTRPAQRPAQASQKRTFVSGHPKVSEFNALPALPGAGQRRQAANDGITPTMSPGTPLVVGSSTRSFIDMNGKTWTATLKAAGEHGNIWVADNCITQSYAQEMAEKFDIIYVVQTNVMGYENGGGPDGDGGMDGDKKIQIFVYSDPASNAGGYFHAKDLHTTDQYATSNEAEMIYILAESTWDKTYGYLMMSHELQHLINYTRKNIQAGIASPTWYNELLSAMTEEVFSLNYLPYQWTPRLSEYLQWKSGTDGFFPSSISNWYSASAYFNYNYGEKSSFGGYLLRHYGGAKLVKAMMDNEFVGMESLEAAIQELGFTDDLETVMTHFYEALIFNSEDEDTLGISLKTYEKTSIETINGITYTVEGFNVEDTIRAAGFEKSFPTLLRPYSVNIYLPDAMCNRFEDVSLTVTPPSNGAKLFLVVK